jgi:hypothetical protein
MGVDGYAGQHVELFELAHKRNLDWRIDPSRLIFFPFRKCKVRVLLVADGGADFGGLDFGSGDFGLQAFIKLLQSPSYYVTYELTLAHRGSRSGDAMLEGDATISRRISNFRFDNGDHFAGEMYDEVWLFGIESTPAIAQSEARAVAEYMDGGGGLFATGDHGALGKAMGAQIPRARSMRLWDHTAAPDEVSMGGPRRNDTNRIGHDADSQFDDQSDDVPQKITPKLYRASSGVWEAVYPHPLLCGRRGIIKVMPDHPHEGECVEPADVDQDVTLDGASFQEYPAGTNGNPRPLPEVISTSSVLAGTTSGGKQATDPHSFGGICAYDGHRASVGRVVTDATWHHFVNVNLVGEANAAPPKDVGFLASPQGQSHLDDIKNYYANLAVWLARPELIACMNRRILWATIFDGRVIEAVATTYEVNFEKARFHLLWEIGKHARDVLGRATSVCQGRRLIIDLIRPYIRPEILVRVDPWIPKPPWPDPEPEPGPFPPGPDPGPWFDPTPLIDAALGGALVALRDEFLDADVRGAAKGFEKRFDQVVEKAVAVTLERATEHARGSLEAGLRLFEGGPSDTSSKA